MDIDEVRKRKRERIAQRRAETRARGDKLPSDSWAARNPDKHREKTARWRADNHALNRILTRAAQARRRSTPWGTINNRIWPTMHRTVRSNSSRPSKYTAALGYLWSDLRAHLEAQFQPDWGWHNWGVAWELDHIVPLSRFCYTSLDDPLFREAWRLSNLRPLCKQANGRKGATHD